MIVRLIVALAVGLALLMTAAGAHAYPIVTMPTATQVAERDVSLNYYWVDLRPLSPFAPDTLQIAACYLGLTSRSELGLTYLKPESVDGHTNVGFQYLAVEESRDRPACAVGLEDITRDSGDTSLYIALAKTVTPVRGRAPSYPAVRLHLGYGTEPRSAIFGGVQIRFSREVGVVALSDLLSILLRAGHETLAEGRDVGPRTLGRSGVQVVA
jgi:hypothetical protein